MKIGRTLITIICGFISTAIIAQIQYDNVRFIHPVKDALLPSGTINSIIQDKYGIMWFATKGGLCSYDGYKVNLYSQIDGDPNSISDNVVHLLHNDPSGNYIWILTDDGLCRLDLATLKFKKYLQQNDVLRPSILHTTSNNELLLLSKNKVWRYDSDMDEFKPHLIMSSATSHNCRPSIVDYGTNQLWVITNQGLKAYNRESKKELVLPVELQSLAKDIRIILKISPDELLIVTNKDYVYIYNSKQDRLRKIVDKNLRNTIIRTSIIDSNGNYWVGTEHGIFVYNQELRCVAHYQQGQSSLSQLNDNPIYSLYMDNDNNIWVGTYFGGVNCYISGTDIFRNYPSGYSSYHLSGKTFRAFAESKEGDLYVAAENGGLNTIKADGEIIRSEDNKIPQVGSNIHSLYIDSEDNLWIGYFHDGISVYNLKTGYSRVVSSEKFPILSCFAIKQDKIGGMWFGGPNGTYYMSKAHSELELVSSLKSHTILDLTDSTFLLGDRSLGLHMLNIRTKSIIRINPKELSNLYVTYLYKDSKDRIWLCTNSKGLYLLNDELKIEKRFAYDEIGTNSVMAIIEDDNGLLWVTTNNGLHSIEMGTNSIISHHEVDGLPNNKFNYSSAYKKKNGELYFGTINGLVSFFPQLLGNIPRENFNVYLTSINSGDKIIPTNKKFSLSYEDARYVTFHYSGLNYKYRENTIYAVKLEGHSDEWYTPSTINSFSFMNLEPGQYHLLIKGSRDGVRWDERGLLKMQITVRYPWWERWWAILLYIFLFLLVIYFVTRHFKKKLELESKVKEIQQEKNLAEDLNRQKINFFLYISHDLKTPLTLILSPIQRLIDNYSFDEKLFAGLQLINRNASRMKYLIEELLEFSKIEMKQSKILTRRGDIVSFVNELGQAFIYVAQDRNIKFEINCKSTGEEVWFSPSKVERIVYNLLSNAFKYTAPQGIVELETILIKQNKQTFAQIRVKDTGRGIAKSEFDSIFQSYYQTNKEDHRNGFGLGLALTKSLVQIHKGEIFLDSEEGKGSEFKVLLNISYNAYSDAERLDELITPSNMKKYHSRISDTIELMGNTSMPLENEGNRQVLLVVEDNSDMNNYICSLFTKDFNVINCYDGVEACEKLKDTVVDFIVSDVMMPNMDGYELVKRLKNDINYNHIPIVLLTARGEDSDQRIGYESGADAYMQKPFNSYNLELLVKNILKQKERNIENFKRSSNMEVEQIVNNNKDRDFINSIKELVLDNIKDEDFSISIILEKLAVSRTLLHVKLKSLTGYSITQFIRSIKMKEAKKYLQQGYNVSETSYAIGISDPNYFTKSFKKEFNMTPREFVKSISPDSDHKIDID